MKAIVLTVGAVDRPREFCPQCKELVLIRKDGTLRNHKSYRFPTARCPGSGARVRG